MIDRVEEYDLGKSIKYHDYDHILCLDEIDCKKRIIRVKKIIFYDDDKKVLERGDFFMNKERLTFLTEDELTIIQTISKYCVIDELERNNILDRGFFREKYNGMNDFEKLIITQFQYFQRDIIEQFEKSFN